MTKGLVRANNLADLSNKQDSIVNLGLAIADYDSLKSLYTTAGLDFSVIGGIAGSTGNYQAQVDGISSTLSGIVLSGFVNRQGNGLISTSWANSDGIISISGVLSGYSPSSGTTFALSIEQGEAVITTSGLSANDLAYNSFRQANSTVVRASPPSGFNTLQLIPLQVGGQSFFVQASETPSFHIAPARMRHALDLVTGNLLGTYNSASPAMAVGPDGILYQPAANAPVIEYDPATLQCLGARIWEVVTNNLLQSENLATTWTIFGATLNANIATAPNTTSTADKLEETATTGEHRAGQASTGGATTSAVTFSVFVKAAERTKIRLAFSSVASWSGGGGAAVIFDLIAGSGSVDSSTPTAFGIQAYPNGWYRCWITGTPTVSLTPVANVFLFTTSGIYAGTAGSGAFLWGGQLNPGLIAPYVPTTTLAASSTADVWDITSLTAGINNIRTVYARVRTAASANHGIIALDDTTSSNRLKLLSSGTDAKVTAVTSGSTVADLIGGTIVANKTFNVAARFDGNNYAISVNGAPVVTDNDGARAIVGRIMLGRGLQAGEYLNGYIEEIAGWTRACTDAQVAALAAS